MPLSSVWLHAIAFAITDICPGAMHLHTLCLNVQMRFKRYRHTSLERHSCFHPLIFMHILGYCLKMLAGNAKICMNYSKYAHALK